MKGDRAQMNFFEMAQEERKKSAKPILEIGQLVFVLSLDVVLPGVVGRSWVCGKDDEVPYFGYSIDGCGVIWDPDIGKTVFDNESDADRRAESIGRQIVKIVPTAIDAHEIRGFEYCRKCDNHRLTACVAKVGDAQLYEHNFMCYHFLRTYPTQKGRDEAYKKLLSKLLEESERSNAAELESPQFEALYRVTDALFASREYAARHKMMNMRA